jgi:hypothetical protein
VIWREGTTPPADQPPLILLDKLAILSTNIVELMTTWFVAISLVRTEAMVIIAIVGVRAFLVLVVLVLVVSTIGGIEIGVPTRFIPIEFRTPVLFVFCNNLVSASATFGVLVVCWNRHYIAGIDLDDHGLAILPIGEVRKILDRAEVESIGTGAFLVLVHPIARHLTYFANRVVELARVNVEVIATNILEGEEVTILGDWEFSCFQEVVEFIDCSLAWIIHEVLEEVQEWLMWKSLTHEVEDSFGQSVVNDLSMIVDRTILDLNIGSIEI